MKRISYIAPIHAESPTGEPMFRDVAGVKTPVALDQYDFLRERTVDAPFTDGLKGFEAQEIVYETRLALRKQKDEAPKLGYWELEDEPAKRILKSTAEGNYNPQFAFNAVPLMRAVAAMTTPDESKPLAQAAE